MQFQCNVYRVKAGKIDTLGLCIPVIEVNIPDGLNIDLYDRYVCYRPRVSKVPAFTLYRPRGWEIKAHTPAPPGTSLGNNISDLRSDKAILVTFLPRILSDSVGGQLNNKDLSTFPTKLQLN